MFLEVEIDFFDKKPVYKKRSSYVSKSLQALETAVLYILSFWTLPTSSIDIYYGNLAIPGYIMYHIDLSVSC